MAPVPTRTVKDGSLETQNDRGSEPDGEWAPEGLIRSKERSSVSRSKRPNDN